MILLLYLLFFISFSCVYAKEKGGLHDPDNNDIAKVEDILRELNAERSKNRDLN